MGITGYVNKQFRNPNGKRRKENPIKIQNKMEARMVKYKRETQGKSKELPKYKQINI